MVWSYWNILTAVSDEIASTVIVWAALWKQWQQWEIAFMAWNLWSPLNPEKNGIYLEGGSGGPKTVILNPCSCTLRLSVS